jgi:glycosyltransferase involved in cell wall biosynthesis
VSQTIDSILAQQCNFDFEIIIGDDCSKDNARKVLSAYQAKYPEKIKLLFYERNIGLGANWATCVKECCGEYIANCDNDDYWHNPKKLQLQVEFMQKNPNYGLCHTDYRKHDRNSGKITEIKCENISRREDETQQDAVMWGHFVCCNASVMYRRDVLLKHVNLDNYIKYRFTLQDWNTWMLLAPYTEFGCLHVSTATFGIETTSITRPQSIAALERRFVAERECYKYICDTFPDRYKYEDKGWNSYAWRRLLGMAYRIKDFSSAKKYARKLLSSGNTSIAAKMAQHIVTFYAFVWAKALINKAQ